MENTNYPSFLKPKQVAEPKAKKQKVTKEKKTVEAKTDLSTNTSSIKKYTQSKLKNDYDTVVKRIDKLTESISKHDDILKANKEQLKELQTKKQELEDLKSQV